MGVFGCRGMFLRAMWFSRRGRCCMCGSFVWLLASLLIAGVRCFGQMPSITLQPASQTVFYGDPVTFQVIATGSEPLSYQWFRNDSAVSAANIATLNLPAVGGADHEARF